MRKVIIWIFIILSVNVLATPSSRIQPGAYRLEQYLPLLQEKRVALFANHTSMVGDTHLIDILLQHHIQVVKIFAPEHGFRGEQDSKISNSVDAKTNIPIVSLYGKRLKPTAEDLQDVDVVVFDIQDVGVRFYTYISSLQKLMEALAVNNKPLIILDRPNPNGFYVDGPILDPQYKSFTGMQPVPIVYGMTMGEYAKMLKGEEWLELKPKSLAKDLQLTVIPCKNYAHKDLYEPPIKPSPNLGTIQSIYWYPSIGLMEATAMSVGRGSDTPFQVFGHPAINEQFSFVPVKVVCGAKPRYQNQICYGWNLQGTKEEVVHAVDNRLQIKYVIAAYHAFPDKNHFFQGFAASSGSDALETQIKAGMSEQEIRQSWEKPLADFKKIRKVYLIYPDFD